jgi:tetratricopeptide (TPR) repeat protein
MGFYKFEKGKMKPKQQKILWIFLIQILIAGKAPADGFIKGFESLDAPAEKASALVQSLEKQLAEEKTQAGQAKLSLSLGILLYKTGQAEAAEKALKKSIELGTRLNDYAEFFLGRIAADKKDWDRAKSYFIKIKKTEAELQLAVIAQKQQKWAESIRLLKALEKKYRRDPSEHSEVLLSLFQAARSKGVNHEACFAALKIYSRYPLISMSKGWGEDLTGGTSQINCPISRPDIQKRFSQLLLNGELQQLRKEVLFWQNKLRATDNPHPQDLGFLEAQLGRAPSAGHPAART